MADQQRVQETQLGSSHEEEVEEDMMAYDVVDDGDENNRRPVFDGLISSSSSLQLNISTNNNSVTVKREEAVAVAVAGGGVVGVNGVSGMRVCSECGKQFSSGKALGGHKRACLQSKNNRLKLKQPTIKIEVAVELGGGGGSGKSSSNVDQGGDHRCCVCDQGFATVKSLYGHMRKHPERHWRGIHPPQHQQPLNHHHHHHHLSGSSTFSNDHNDVVDGDNDDDVDVDVDVEERGGHVAVDLVESLKGWSVKDKRGRKSSANNSEEVEADPVDKEAASNLFFLAQTLQDYRVFGGHYSNKKLKLELDRPADHHHASSGYGVLKIKERMPAETDHHQESHEMDTMRNIKQQKKRKLTELEPNTYKFYCPICNKGFDKHQALGGHVASHNNKSKNLNLAVNTMKESSASVEAAAAAAAAEEESNDQQDSGGGPAGGDDDRSSRVNSELGGGGDQLHQCNICSKNFPTGQALGGHKRCHWTGPGINFPEAFSSSSQVTTSTGEVSQTPPAPSLGGLDVDLNDTPQEFYQFFGFPEPGDHQEAEAGAGGAASKDNNNSVR